MKHNLRKMWENVQHNLSSTFIKAPILINKFWFYFEVFQTCSFVSQFHWFAEFRRNFSDLRNYVNFFVLFFFVPFETLIKIVWFRPNSMKIYQIKYGNFYQLFINLMVHEWKHVCRNFFTEKFSSANNWIIENIFSRDHINLDFKRINAWLPVFYHKTLWIANFISRGVSFSELYKFLKTCQFAKFVHLMVLSMSLMSIVDSVEKLSKINLWNLWQPSLLINKVTMLRAGF